KRLIAGQEIILERFQIMDWFPRAPGLYHTDRGAFARDEALRYQHPVLSNAPIHAASPRVGPIGRDHTIVFTPEGKFSMLQGGVASVRLKPIRIEGKPHWLIAATSDGAVHGGLPIAVPTAIYGKIHSDMEKRGSACATVVGELSFVDDPI